jgi:uncharacterized phage protein (TIGR02218 family)
MAGRYDYAEIEIFIVNYEDLSMGRMPVKTGWLGEVTCQDGRFVAEVRGLTQRLAQTVGAHFSPTCRAALGDARCGVDTQALEVTGSITAVAGRTQFSDSTRSEANGYFNYGVITFTSGANAGLAMELRQFTTGGQFITMLPLPYAVEVGDAYRAIPGCDKRFATCTQRYGNAVNFRGEPHVPGMDAILQTSGTL